MHWDLVAYYVKKSLAVGMLAVVILAVIIFWVAACFGIAAALVWIWEHIASPLAVYVGVLVVAFSAWISN